MLELSFSSACRWLSRAGCVSSAQSMGLVIQRRWAVAIVALLVTMGPSAALAQTTVSSVQPRSCRPGETTRLVVAGQGFAEGLRAAATQTGATVAIESVQPDRATLDVTLPADAPLGPLGLWLASASGPTAP